MHPFRRILIALDGTEKDCILINNMALMSRFMSIHKIYFIHISMKQYIPASIKEKFPEVQELDIGDLKDSLNDQIIKYFPDINKYNHDLVLSEGDRTEVLIDFINRNEIDFLAMGRRPSPGIPYLARKIGHLSPCSLGFFPVITKEKFKRIVVPVDFTEASIEGLNRAFFYHENDHDIEILPVHFFTVPTGYYKTGKSFKEFQDIMRSNADTNFKKIFEMPQFKNQKPAYDVIFDKEANPVPRIFNYVLSKEADLMIIGSRKRAHFASFMLGTVAMKLIELLYHIPILIEKDTECYTGFNEFLSSNI